MNTPVPYTPFLKIARICMISAPIFLLLGDILWQLSGNIAVGTFIRWISYVLFIPAIICLAYLLQGKSKKLGLWGSGLCLIGILGGVSILTLYRLSAVLPSSKSGVPTIIENALFSNPLLPVTIFIPGLLFPIGLLVFGIAIYRSNKLHWLPSIAMFLSGITFWMGNALNIIPVLFICDLLLFGIFVWTSNQIKIMLSRSITIL